MAARGQSRRRRPMKGWSEIDVVSACSALELSQFETVIAGLDSAHGCAVLRSKLAQIRRLLPLTLPLRGSLPLPARGKRVGVRGQLLLTTPDITHSDRWPG